jgi:hypothetical protein
MGLHTSLTGPTWSRKMIFIILEIIRLKRHQAHYRSLLAPGRDFVGLERIQNIREGLAGRGAFIWERGASAGVRARSYAFQLGLSQ